MNRLIRDCPSRMRHTVPPATAPMKTIKRFPLLTAAACAIWAAALATGTRAAPQSTPPSRVDFQKQIQPIVAKHCIECHSQDRRRGGLSLASYADFLEGGKN